MSIGDIESAQDSRSGNDFGDLVIERRRRPDERREGRPEWVKRSAKGMAYVAASTLGAFAISIAAFALAMLVHLRGPFGDGGVTAPFEAYVHVLWGAGFIRAGLFLTRRHHRNRRYRGYADEVGEGLREAMLGSLAIVVFAFFWRGGSAFRAYSYARAVFLLDWGFASIGMSLMLVGSKAVLGALRAKGHNLRTVAIVGDSTTARSFQAAMADHAETGFEVIGHLQGRRKTDGDVVTELAELDRITPVDEVILATQALSRWEIAELVSLSQLRHIKVRAVPELFGLPPTKVGLEPAGDFPLLSLLDDPLRGSRRFMKRSLDVIGCAVVLVLLSPVMLAAALAVRSSSKGSVLFSQERIGMDGRPFMMLKFRSMYAGGDHSAHAAYVEKLIKNEGDQHDGLFKMAHDPRITSAGRWLRRFSIDELPQLFNVLKGDMSLVGPRPPLSYEVAAYEEHHRRRLDVRPGMTGLWQVSGRSKLSFEDMVRLDLHYIESWTPLSDVTIMLKTIPALVRHEAS